MYLNKVYPGIVYNSKKTEKKNNDQKNVLFIEYTHILHSLKVIICIHIFCIYIFDMENWA